MKGKPKYPLAQADLVSLAEWRGQLLTMREIARRAGLSSLVDTLGPPIGVVDALIHDGLDPVNTPPV